jgi:hypothetical protein
MSFSGNWCWIGPYHSVITACSPFNETGDCRRAFQGAATGYEVTRSDSILWLEEGKGWAAPEAAVQERVLGERV